MESSSAAARVLIVAHRTAATPTLFDRVRARADESPCEFVLLVPDLHRLADPDSREGEIVLELAVPLLEQATGEHVDGLVGDPDPFVAVRDLLAEREIDEIILCTLPPRVSRWLATDLPDRLSELGKPVSVVTTPEAARPIAEEPADAS
jgi:hypothetical protein